MKSYTLSLLIAIITVTILIHELAPIVTVAVERVTSTVAHR